MATPTDRLHWLCAFASLHWYEETIKFVFTFFTKTSELVVAAGIIISTAIFLPDGDIMNLHKALSDAWEQALVIDSSLGTVFIRAFQLIHDSDKVRHHLVLWFSVIFRDNLMFREKWFTSIGFSSELSNNTIKICISLHGR